jgi:hypothetical protein
VSEVSFEEIVTKYTYTVPKYEDEVEDWEVRLRMTLHIK